MNHLEYVCTYTDVTRSHPYACTAESLIGPGALKTAGNIVKSLNLKKAMIVTDEVREVGVDGGLDWCSPWPVSIAGLSTPGVSYAIRAPHSHAPS